MAPGNLNQDPSLARLIEAESVLVRSGDVASAKEYAYSVLHAAINPLEAVNNLVYLTRQVPEDAALSKVYLEMIEGQLKRLNEIVLHSLTFCTE